MNNSPYSLDAHTLGYYVKLYINEQYQSVKYLCCGVSE